MMRGMANVSLAGKHQKAAAPQRTSAPSSRNATKVYAAGAAKFYLSTNAPHASSTNLQQK
jgi:hypothetical protein